MPRCFRAFVLTLASIWAITTAEGSEADQQAIPVTVTGEVRPAAVKQGEPIALAATIRNGLKGPIGYSTFSLKPNGWNGETVSLTLVDVYRNGETRSLFLEHPKVDVPRELAGMAWHRIEAGKSLTVTTDARKWKIVDGWKPGKYKVTVRVERLTADNGRCLLSVQSAPFEFEIR